MASITDLAVKDKTVRTRDVHSKQWREHTPLDASSGRRLTQQPAHVANVVAAAAVQIAPKHQSVSSSESKHTSHQQVLVTAEQPMLPHLADGHQLQPPHKRQRYADVRKPSAEPSSQPQQQETKAPQQQQQQHQKHVVLLQQQSALPRHQKGLPPLPQQQQPPSPYQRGASPEARMTDACHAAAGYGGTTAVATGAAISSARHSKERSLSGQLLSPPGGSSVLLGLQDLTGPTPYAPKYYISNDGTIAVVKQQQQHEQRKRLSLSIPAEDPAPTTTAATGCSGGQSPVANMMASLVAETATARAPSIAITSWGNPAPALFGLFSPTAAGALDMAANTLVSPRVTAGPAAVSSGLGSLELQHSQELLGRPTGQQVSGVAARPMGRKRPLDASLLDPRCAEMCNAAQAAAVAALGSSSSGVSDLAALQQWQQTIEAGEQHWGSSHPAVGRAWLELARVWQATDKEADKAKYATKKAFDICQILLKQTAMESHAQESFQYLLDKFNRKSTAAKQAQQAAASAALQAAAGALEPSAATASAVAPPGFVGFAPMAPVHPALQQQQYQQYSAVTFVPSMYMPPEAGGLFLQHGVLAGYGPSVHRPTASTPSHQQQQAEDADSASQDNMAATLHAGMQHSRGMHISANREVLEGRSAAVGARAGVLGSAVGRAGSEAATPCVQGT